MAKAHVAHSIGPKNRATVAKVSAWLASGARHLSWLPLTLVVLSWPDWLSRRSCCNNARAICATIFACVGEPGRLLLGELRLGLARELAFAQRFTVSRDRCHLFEFQRTATRDDSLLARSEHDAARDGTCRAQLGDGRAGNSRSLAAIRRAHRDEDARRCPSTGRAARRELRGAAARDGARRLGGRSCDAVTTRADRRATNPSSWSSRSPLCSWVASRRQRCSCSRCATGTFDSFSNDAPRKRHRCAGSQAR